MAVAGIGSSSVMHPIMPVLHGIPETVRIKLTLAKHDRVFRDFEPARQLKPSLHALTGEARINNIKRKGEKLRNFVANA